MNKGKTRWRWPVISLAALLFLGSVIGLAGCRQGAMVEGAPERQVASGDTGQMALGDPRQGPALVAQLGCGSCHTVPGVRVAVGAAGPPLDFWPERIYIAGELINSPNNTVAWILAPQAVEPGTAMPDLKLTVGQARDIAAYLYTLRRGETR
jgi:cytochrome c